MTIAKTIKKGSSLGLEFWACSKDMKTWNVYKGPARIAVKASVKQVIEIVEAAEKAYELSQSNSPFRREASK